MGRSFARENELCKINLHYNAFGGALYFRVEVTVSSLLGQGHVKVAGQFFQCQCIRAPTVVEQAISKVLYEGLAEFVPHSRTVFCSNAFFKHKPQCIGKLA